VIVDGKQVDLNAWHIGDVFIGHNPQFTVAVLRRLHQVMTVRYRLLSCRSSKGDQRDR